jgi:hypothetical protein
MMAQAARDPLFKACVAIANQDAPDSGDLCIRCHSPKGWLEGRSIPTDMSALTGTDYEGLLCDFCHKMVKPSPVGANPYPEDTNYTNDTYPVDQAYLESLPNIPSQSGNGMYVVDSSKPKRGPFWDAEARHQMLYSPFHQDANLCGTCHDVSNPAFDRQPDDTYLPNAFGAPAPSQDKYTMFPVERTFSEWLNSDYNSATGVYAPQFGGNKDYVASCQDCHMPDATALGCNKKGAPLRDDMPIHDLTGGNTFVPTLIPQVFPGETDEQALAEGIARARAMLQKAATLEVATTETGSGVITDVRIYNETGHKLPSGYPEGRRMWLNVIGRDSSGAINYESASYDPLTATLDTGGDAKIYEIHLGMSPEVAGAAGLTPGKSFHFVLNNYVVFDNRIPPRGFTNAAFETIQSPPVGVAYADGEYWDDTQYTLPVGTIQVEVNLYYQTVSKEYIEFLRDENVTNGDGQIMYDLWANNGMSTPELMASQTVVLGQIDDNEPPTAPADLVAATASNRAIDLAWTESTDNIGVTGYEVFRDGAPVGTTTGTTFTDSGLSSSTTYTYQVTAFDAGGNVSAPSNVASATTAKKGGGGGGGGKPRGALAQSGTTVMLAPDVNPAPAEGTGLSFYLPEASHVRLRVVDVAGRQVAEISNESLPAGHHQVYFDARGVSAGMYFAVLETDTGREVAKISIVH